MNEWMVQPQFVKLCAGAGARTGAQWVGGEAMSAEPLWEGHQRPQALPSREFAHWWFWGGGGAHPSAAHGAGMAGGTCVAEGLLCTHLPWLCCRWRRRTGSSGSAAAPLEAAPSGGSGLCSPKRRYVVAARGPPGSAEMSTSCSPKACGWEAQKLLPGLHPDSLRRVSGLCGSALRPEGWVSQQPELLLTGWPEGPPWCLLPLVPHDEGLFTPCPRVPPPVGLVSGVVGIPAAPGASPAPSPCPAEV